MLKQGGIIAIIAPFIETVTSQLNENIYKTQEAKWNEFLTDADTLLDNYHELLGITKAIKAGELGEVNEALNSLKEETKKFLKDYDKDNNGEVDLEELIEKLKDLANDVGTKEKKEGKLWELVETMQKLEDQVIAYRQGTLGQAENINEKIKTEIEDKVNNTSF